jgi:hypothetical protein
MDPQQKPRQNINSSNFRLRLHACIQFSISILTSFYLAITIYSSTNHFYNASLNHTMTSNAGSDVSRKPRTSCTIRRQYCMWSHAELSTLRMLPAPTPHLPHPLTHLPPSLSPLPLSCHLRAYLGQLP